MARFSVKPKPVVEKVEPKPAVELGPIADPDHVKYIGFSAAKPKPAEELPDEGHPDENAYIMSRAEVEDSLARAREEELCARDAAVGYDYPPEPPGPPEAA
jgi:hypothetical protein